MNMGLREDKFHVRAYFAPCFCSCKFCCLGDIPKTESISFDDYEEVLRKFSQIKESHSMRLRSYVYNCVEHPYVGRQIRVYEELGMEKSEFTQLDLNGTKIKPKIEIKKWFDELQTNGVNKVAFSLFGLEKIHDDFVNKKGYFQYLIDCMKVAEIRNIPVVCKVFLHRGILDDVDTLIEVLEKYSDCIIIALMEYSGKAKQIESSYIRLEDYNLLSGKVKQYISKIYIDKFRSEREWIELVDCDKFPEFKIVDYILYLNSNNIEYIKKASVDDIINEFRRLDKKIRNSFEDIKKLSFNYGDKNCDILYECRDVLRKWLDLLYKDKMYDSNDLFSFTSNSVEWKIYERL